MIRVLAYVGVCIGVSRFMGTAMWIGGLNVK